MNKFFIILICLCSTFSINAQTIDTVCPYRYSNPSGLGLNPEHFVEYNGFMYFIGNYALDTKQYLWKSDGTWAGSTRVKEINPGTPGTRYSSVNSIQVVNNLMYFFDTYQKSLWRSDGTANGTFTIMKGNSIYKLAELNSKVYFFALNANNFAEFWQTDGTVNGTQLIKTLESQKITFVNWPSFNLIKFKNKLVFDGVDNLNGVQLWESDGTSNGTKLLRKLALTKTFSTAKNFILMNDILFFGSDDSSGNHKLWRSDGTEKGTYAFSDKFRNAWNYFIVFKDKLYFNAHDNSIGGNFGQLFVTDGTDTGTHVVYSKVFKLSGVNLSFDPSNFTIMNNELYMTAASESYGYQIWKTDGTTLGTVRITAHDSLKGKPQNLKVFDNHIIYLAGIYSVYTPLMHYTNGTVGDFHYQEAYDDWKDNAYYDTEFFPFKNALYFNSNCTSLDEYELYKFSFSMNTSISNSNLSKAFINVFPNPSNNIVNIQSNEEIQQILVYNDLGQKLLELAPNSSIAQIELNLSGLYSIQIRIGDTIQTKKIVIQN